MKKYGLAAKFNGTIDDQRTQESIREFAQKKASLADEFQGIESMRDQTFDSHDLRLTIGGDVDWDNNDWRTVATFDRQLSETEARTFADTVTEALQDHGCSDVNLALYELV